MYVKQNTPNKVQMDHGRYGPLFWTANTEFADKKTHFDWKFGLFTNVSNVNKQIRG